MLLGHREVQMRGHVAILRVEVGRVHKGGCQYGRRTEWWAVVVARGTCWDEEALCLQSHG